MAIDHQNEDLCSPCLTYAEAVKSIKCDLAAERMVQVLNSNINTEHRLKNDPDGTTTLIIIL